MAAKNAWATTTNDRRKRRMITITLSDEAREWLAAKAVRPLTRSAIVEGLILLARARQP